MATVDKNFKVKNGLVVEGTSGTINGSEIITEDIITGGTQTNIAVTYDAQTKTVNFVAENGVADSTTDDLTEGLTNLYYTDERVEALIKSAINGGTQTNISVQYDTTNNQLNFVAENGVADSTTDDLEEGSVNLYFTDQRAVDAVISGAVNTDDIEEGETNLYFTDQRAIDAVGGSATSENTPNTVVKRDYNGDFAAGDITADSILLGQNASVGYDINGGRLELNGNLGIALLGGTGNIRIESGQDIILVPETGHDGDAYIGSAYAGNEIATHSYVDQAEAEANAYADGLATNYDPAGSAYKAQTDAQSYADGLAINYDPAGAAASALADANDYTDTAVAGLVDSAPDLLNTLNELAAAIGDDENFVTTITTGLSEKVAKSGDTMTGDLVLPGDPTLDLHAAPKQYVDQVGADAVILSNEYTDQQIVAGNAAATPIYEALNVNDVAKQVAAKVSGTAATPATAYSWAKASYRTAKFLVKTAYGTHTEVSEVMITLDTSDNIAITEYAIVGTNGTLSSITASIAGSNVNLLVTPANNSTITVFGTLLAEPATVVTAASIIAASGAVEGSSSTWTSTNSFLLIGGYPTVEWNYADNLTGAPGLSFASLAEVQAELTANPTGYAASVYDISDAANGHIVTTYMGASDDWYNINSSGNVIPF